MDCPYTGKGEELSPTDLVESALGGCMLLSMGALAMRNNLDITGTRIDVSITSTGPPVMRFKDISIVVAMPGELSSKDRIKLERAAEGCPIKHSFNPEISITVSYNYPD